ncbi:PREDICTED: LOC110746824 partial [Prunus dulcis]|uniref:PREDICTED: LOC110746824 partial n=1 Tax=Prunus dulcis TaxID=3755 RepID=A0A5E4FKC1_PRUDU|nr:hypothetical protein L3X38_025326 [Prunus dulcis]VVA28553.1 PREDICTED: LOC110746824 partial [Prunus dulcis]
MTTTSVPVLKPQGLSFEKQSRASPAPPACTSVGSTFVIQTTVEAELLAQITALWQDMARLQEHNNLLSSKVDETQQLLNHQHVQNIQTTKSSQSLQTRSRQKKGKKEAKAKPAPSKRLVVLAPKDKPHLPKKVYFDGRH